MNRIRLLSEQVANQIAAGEVVERPVSVVKELVENSLDAQAERITVEIQAGGRSLIRITDDGVGMSRDDALLCLERHATSKIQQASDLSAIRTMGFRGEALPSIASVSRFSLITRERDSESPEACQVIVQGGKVVEVRSAGGPSGTTLEVRQLFFNVPARKKFLRTEETESAHIEHYLTVAALAHPHVGFTLVKDGRTVWQLPSGKPPAEGALPLEAVAGRLKTLLGGDMALLPVDVTSELAEIAASMRSQDPDAYEDLQSRRFRLWGFIGRPGVSRSSRDQHHVFVNRRPIENRGINFALLEGYHTSLMKGRYPVCCLFLEIDPARVDVNIHPTKREVKFHNEAEIRRLTADAIRQTLLEFHSRQMPAVPAMRSTESLGGPLPVASAASAGAPGPVAAPQELPGLHNQPKTHAPAPMIPLLMRGGVQGGEETAATGARTSDPGVFKTASAPTASPKATFPAIPPAAAPALGQGLAPQALLQVPLRIVGVVGRLYVVLESDRGLVLMDQHAAHERILFEQMLRRLEQGDAVSQRLLLPETLELGVRDVQLVKELMPTLTRLGVGLSEFGDRTFLLDGLPPCVKAPDAKSFVLGLIDELRKAGDGVNALRLGEDVIAKTVCRHAVKANDPLKGPELEGLLADLRRCEMPYTCPHGRPTLIEMSFRELEKKFGRVGM